MPNYLTPTRYRSMPTGTSLTGKTDAELSSLIAGASAFVNVFCCVPEGHDFRGGTIIDERHPWHPGDAREVGTYRIWPFHRPIKEAISLVIDVTNGQRLTFDNPDQLYVEPVQGYIEPVDLALTSFGVFGWAILPNVGLRVPVGKASYTYGYDLVETDELTSSTSDVSLQLSNQFLTDEEVIATKGGDQFTAFTVDKTEGIVTLNSEAADTYTFTYHHKMPRAIGDATAVIMTEALGAARIAQAGLSGLSGIKVKEVELRQSKASFLGLGMSPLAENYLSPFVIRSMA